MAAEARSMVLGMWHSRRKTIGVLEPILVRTTFPQAQRLITYMRINMLDFFASSMFLDGWIDDQHVSTIKEQDLSDILVQGSDIRSCGIDTQGLAVWSRNVILTDMFVGQSRYEGDRCPMKGADKTEIIQMQDKYMQA
ncbi:unnamed protein product [Clonostachys byssicola]|uniref:Uncharacterized protein n=1 Tax=Clonostachys byssicola TaxID=160290 RepID=A0A9N9U8C3_9HYPO|nr:unnamed protein product [Clonostachys byssicola]